MRQFEGFRLLSWYLLVNLIATKRILNIVLYEESRLNSYSFKPLSQDRVFMPHTILQMIRLRLRQNNENLKHREVMSSATSQTPTL